MGKQCVRAIYTSIYIFGIYLYLFIPLELFAFPEMQRHGYTNCTSCHASPNGGGALTEYGRALITEALSTWGTEEESATGYVMKEHLDWLDIGGDIRSLFLYRNNPNFQEGKWIFMQTDLELRGKYKGFSAGGSIGAQEKRVANNKTKYSSISRQHYIMYKPFDGLNFRFGRFFTAYGLNIPDHFSSIKTGLGFDQGLENYNLEASYITESWSHFFSIFFGQPRLKADQKEKGFALRSSFAPTEMMKIGGSYYYGNQLTQTRHLIGPYAVLGFTEHLFLLSELDFQFVKPKLKGALQSTSGLFAYNKLGYGVIQGLIPYFVQENQYANFKNSNSHAYSHGLGVQWFPRPHWEFNLTFTKSKSAQFNRDYVDYAYFLAHFYL